VTALVIGVVNVTPDSFSDGGLFLDPERAIAHARDLVAEGADLLDIGGESTRPGSEGVSAEEEMRVLPVLEGLSGVGAPISIDTSKRAVAEAALDAGAEIVNDVTALRSDPELAELCAERGCGVVLMHMLGTPRTMQDNPTYEDVVDDVKVFLAERIEFALASGIAAERIWIDPGIGFGKTLEHNLELLRRLGELRELGHPICIGTSRKSFIGTITGVRRVTGSAEPSPRTCSPSPTGPGSSGSTTCARFARPSRSPRRSSVGATGPAADRAAPPLLGSRRGGARGRFRARGGSRAARPFYLYASRRDRRRAGGGPAA
jgi:dihydropteroate synthase